VINNDALLIPVCITVDDTPFSSPVCTLQQQTCSGRSSSESLGRRWYWRRFRHHCEIL